MSANMLGFIFWVVGLFSLSISPILGLMFFIFLWGSEGVEIARAAWEGAKFFMATVAGGCASCLVAQILRGK